MTTAHLPADLRTELAKQAANTRLAYMTPEQQRAMTAAATEVREANYLERLKVEIDPDGRLPEDERTRRAGYLREARRAKYRADLARRREREARLATADREHEYELVEAEAS